jgi:hypothetical protein
MWIDPIQTMPDDLLTLGGGPRWLKPRGLRGVSYNTLNRILSHAAISRQSDYPEFVSVRRGLRLSLSLPCTTSRDVVE